MALPSFPLSAESLLLASVEGLQLTRTQHERAERAYKRVSEWIHADAYLGNLAPDLFIQGSMALGTTVKPTGLEEFDIDLVCLFADLPHATSAARLVELVHDRLAEDADLRDRIDPHSPPSCVRLQYAGEFHLDVVPARAHAAVTGAIQIPRRTSNGEFTWLDSHPREFCAWFRAVSRQLLLEDARRAIQPVPQHEAVHDKTPLQLLVQIAKAAREEYSARTGKDCPSSMAISTALGKAYNGAPLDTASLMSVVQEVHDRIKSGEADEVFKNPVFPYDNTLRKPQARQHALGFFQHVCSSLSELSGAPDLVHLQEAATTLFGSSAARVGVQKLGEQLGGAQKSGAIISTSTGVKITGESSPQKANPKHTFFGRALGRDDATPS